MDQLTLSFRSGRCWIKCNFIWRDFVQLAQGKFAHLQRAVIQQGEPDKLVIAQPTGNSLWRIAGLHIQSAADSGQADTLFGTQLARIQEIRLGQRHKPSTAQSAFSCLSIQEPWRVQLMYPPDNLSAWVALLPHLNQQRF